MRTVNTILSVLSVMALLGCAHRSESVSWNDHTILPGGESIASLNALASNQESNRADRARAIFTLFAHHIRPGFSAGEVHRILTDTNWMSEINLYGVYALGGWVPVEMTFEDTVFCLDLFPAEMDKQWSPWAIYFRLSGTTPEGPGRRKEEALAFLHGDTTVQGNPKLLEFALCFPEQPETRRGRIERFSRLGMYVYDTY